MQYKSFYLDANNTFCISLDTAVDRWQRMRARFDHFEMEVTLWPAAKNEDVVDKCADYLSPGQRGCAQSHMNIWRHIVDKKLLYALVVEDDACFDKHWRTQLDAFDLMCSGVVGAMGNGIVDESVGMRKWDMLLLNCSEIVEPTGVWVAAQDQYLTGAYLISLDGARKLVDMFGSNLFAADWMTTRLQSRGRCYTFFPWLVIQEGLDSTIGSGVDADHAKVLRCLNDFDYSLDNYI